MFRRRSGGKWQPPLMPVPSPRILNLPRRSRRRSKPSLPTKNLGYLIQEEKQNFINVSQQQDQLRRRQKVEAEPAPRLSSSGESLIDSGGERWRLEVEILRAECNFLRMEKEAAVQKHEKSRVHAENALRSGVRTLISVKKKMSKKDGAILNEQIEELQERLAELQGVSSKEGLAELDKNSRRNFDRQASVIRRRIERMADETCDREIREIAVSSEDQPPLKQDDHHNNSQRFQEVEMLRRKMEGLSRGMLEKVEEYDHILAGTIAADNAESGREMTHGEARRGQQRKLAAAIKDDQDVCELERCRCTEVVERIMEQVKSEAEQWNEMQTMLDQLRQEMEELQASRDLWQRRAISSDLNARTLQTQVLEWKERARVSEHKVTELKKRIVEHMLEIQSLKADFFNPSSSTLQAQTNMLKVDGIKTRGQKFVPNIDLHREKEKHVLVCRVNNSKNSVLAASRLPLQDIVNL